GLAEFALVRRLQLRPLPRRSPAGFRPRPGRPDKGSTAAGGSSFVGRLSLLVNVGSLRHDRAHAAASHFSCARRNARQVLPPSIAAEGPMMGVFNNLVMYKQDVPQSGFQSIVPDLATDWSWDEDKSRLQ